MTLVVFVKLWSSNSSSSSRRFINTTKLIISRVNTIIITMNNNITVHMIVNPWQNVSEQAEKQQEEKKTFSKSRQSRTAGQAEKQNRIPGSVAFPVFTSSSLPPRFIRQRLTFVFRKSNQPRRHLRMVLALDGPRNSKWQCVWLLTSALGSPRGKRHRCRKNAKLTAIISDGKTNRHVDGAPTRFKVTTVVCACVAISKTCPFSGRALALCACVHACTGGGFGANVGLQR